MSVKRKLMLMGICVAIIILVLSVNVIRRVSEKTSGTELVTVKEDVMTRAEAYRLLSYLMYNRTEREALTNHIKYSDEQMSGWYDTYVNAVCRMGIIGSKVKVNPAKALTYGYCKELIDKLILANPEYQAVYKGLSFEFTKADKDMLISDFLELYHALLDITPKKDRKVSEETLLVLGKEATEDGTDRMVTDQGKYYYINAKNYIEYTKDTSETATNENSKSGDIHTKNDLTMAADSPTALINQYMDQSIKVLVCDQEILYLTAVTTDKIVVHNVWIKEGKEDKVDIFINDIDKSFRTGAKLKTPLAKVIGDITIENQKIVKISVKPDMIKGKVLRSDKNFIEVSGYGKIPLDEHFTIYKIYGELSVEPTDSILLGYENTDFIVSEGKISAALITESIKAQNIRVLLNTTGYNSIYHNDVVFTATSDFIVKTKKKEYKYSKGKKVTIKPGDNIFHNGRVTVKTNSDKGKIKILSIKRSEGNPKYRGTLEIAEDEKGLILINELPLEEYLYSVIPSEMPTSFGIEALKVQAVCARSYAYKHLLANTLSAYGAHVDDSAAYQVYNNVPENEDSILAVKDTYAEVVKYDNKVITAFYYSTSCGHTAEPSNVWSNNVDVPYLKGKLLLTEKGSKKLQAQSTDSGQFDDLSSEKTFEKFINSTDITTYDSEFNWYRWKVTMSVKDIKKVIDSTLKDRYNATPDLILTMTKKAKGSKKAVYESIPIDTVGTIKDIRVHKRESSGVISELIIRGSKNTIKVLKDYNIRALLAPKYDSIIRQDKSEISGLTLLPSSYFIIDRKKILGKLKSIQLTGGGFGHGVGMSQNAVKTLVDSGKNYKQIISYFYEGTQLGVIY